MKYTGNYNLKKPEGTDVVNIGDLNDNADIIDQELKAHNDALNAHKAEKATQGKLGHVKAGRNITIDADGTINAKGGNVDSVNGKTGVVNLTKADVGLGYVQNYGIASKAQAEVGTANDVYMTPLRVKQAIYAVIDVVATGTVTLNDDNYFRERVELPGLGSSPRELTCFYYADSAKSPSSSGVQYSFERAEVGSPWGGFEWKMFVSFQSDESPVTIHYTVVAWNDLGRIPK